MPACKKIIGILAGDGNLPKIVINQLQKKKLNFIVINLSSKKKNKKDHFNLNISQVSKILDLLKKKECKEIILVGKVVRPNIKDLKVDFKLIGLLPRIISNLKKGDAYVLNLVIKILKKHKMKVISCTRYVPELIAQNYPINPKISKQDIFDIKKGKQLLSVLNSKFDIGQSLIINNGFIVGIEAAEGTDKMLSKSSFILKKINKSKKSGLLLKLPKKIQDLRIDLPTIGYKTIKTCINLGLKGIVLKKNQNIFLNQDESFKLMKKNNFFIKVLN